MNLKNVLILFNNCLLNVINILSISEFKDNNNAEKEPPEIPTNLILSLSILFSLLFVLHLSNTL